MNNKLAIIGAGGHSRVVADSARLMQSWLSISFFDDEFEKEKTIATLLNKKSDSFDVFIAIGNNIIREKIQNQFDNADFNIVNIAHPSAIIAQDVTIGIGSFFAAGAIVNPGVKIGRGCIVNTAATVDHDCEIADFAHIAPGARLAGSVNIGTRTWVGIASSISENLTLGSDVMVGAGAAVVSNISDDRVVKGVPAK